MTNLNDSNSTLHILSKPINKAEYQSLIESLNTHDCVLFTRDACYSLLAPYIDITNVSALDIDCEARGIINDKLATISYSQWVELTLFHKNILSW
ncbi:DsrH/TusB family sulfur relay protein [Pseudoalteromonas denitrificans]|jgi:sulfur relay protein TusB/DsrH|uniref:Sulfur relay protein TusB/DsrH n=1 Tax=Pseudoalteromonas denitrificans DSM 6059 TaxID=1123010 RepID=A0A1I1SJH5_9GAMM|nr:DsrH/TusB family sulfur metabolism protein [Pseudoalteromonas denitrificans]SFD46624.1 sulfur relay protein TusB/DsrH [Pseudoalteromonas denitrificans DSM 6059]